MYAKHRGNICGPVCLSICLSIWYNFNTKYVCYALSPNSSPKSLEVITPHMKV